jgi:hypothetical protein
VLSDQERKAKRDKVHGRDIEHQEIHCINGKFKGNILTHCAEIIGKPAGSA